MRPSTIETGRAILGLTLSLCNDPIRLDHFTEMLTSLGQPWGSAVCIAPREFSDTLHYPDLLLI